MIYLSVYNEHKNFSIFYNVVWILRDDWGNLKEETVPIRDGYKQWRRPDITTEAPDGSVYRENVGKTTLSGSPIARERMALDDVEKTLGIRPGYTPYDR